MKIYFSLFINLLVCAIGAGMIVMLPVALYVALISGELLISVITVVGVWSGYGALRFGIALSRVNIRMIREGRQKDNEADAAIIEANLIWPLRGKTLGENGSK